MALNIADLAEHAIDAVPDRVALICGDDQLTYGQLEEKANRLAHYLIDRGVKKDDKVGLYCRNRIEIVIAMLGIVKAGAILVNVNFRYVEGELRYLFGNSDMVALVHERQYADRVANVLPDTPNVKTVLVVDDGSDLDYQRYGGVEFYAALEQGSPERDFGERSADDIYLLYTGGTTGFPKGVMWRHEDIYRVLFGGTDFATGEFVKDEHDLAKAAAENAPMIRYPIPPMIHGATQSATWMSIFSGQTTVLAPEFNADEVWRAIHDHKVNLLFFTGDAMARPLLDALETAHAKGEDYDLSSLFLLASTAALFSTSIKEKLLELLPNRIITDSIGSSETGFGGTSVVAKGEHHMGGPRVTIDHRTVVLDEDGNEVEPGSGVRGVIAKKGNIPVGYYKDEKKTAETFKTFNGVRYAIPGDYAEVEADGTVTMLGRGSVSINSGGEKIYPEEVEAALKGHPDVFDALVVGVPDPRFGQHVAAVVQAREGVRPTLSELDAFVRSEIAGYKVPRSLWFVDEVKRSPAGKPDYRWAKEHTETRPADDVHAKHAGNAVLMHTELCDRFGITYPIFVFTPSEKVAAAVSKAGGLGVLGCVRFNEPEDLEAVLGWMDENTDGKPYGVDVVMPAKIPTEGTATDINKLIPQSHRDFVDKTLADLGVPPLPDDEERSAGVLGWLHSVARSHVEVALKHPIKLIANALGSPPKDVIDQVHGAGVPVAALAGSAKHAQRHVDNGVDIVVAQGHEAGGHTGEIGSIVLWPEIVDALDGRAPVLAAGGIGTGRQVAAALALGASGVWMGSAFLTSAEYDLGHRTDAGTSVIQQALLGATSSDTVRRRIYTGKPARLLKSRWTDAWDAPDAPEPLPMPLQNILVSEAHQRMSESSDPTAVAMPVGQIVGRMNEIRPVADIIAELVQGFEEAARRLDDIRDVN